jgi:hypothetical protein
MQFAAACLAAVDRMRPDPSWSPPPNTLCVRIMVAPWVNRIEFFYTDEPGHMECVARIRNWSGEPDFGGSYECAKGDMDLEAAASPIVRRVADEDDVRALAKLWEHDCSVAEWQKNMADRGVPATVREFVTAAITPIRRARRRSRVAGVPSGATRP